MLFLNFQLIHLLDNSSCVIDGITLPTIMSSYTGVPEGMEKTSGECSLC